MSTTDPDLPGSDPTLPGDDSGSPGSGGSGTVVATGTVIIETGFVPTGAEVEVEIAYEVSDGRLSPYSSSESVGTGTPGSTPDFANIVGTTKPANNATNSADPNSAFGNSTVGATTATLANTIGRVVTLEDVLGPGGTVQAQFADLQQQIDNAGGGQDDSVIDQQVAALEASARGAGSANPNLLLNPQFSDGTFGGWTVGSGSWVVIGPTEVGNFAQNGVGGSFIYQDVAVTAAALYSLSAEMDPDQQNGCYVKIDWFNASGSNLGSSNAPFVYGDSWLRAYTADGVVQAPNGATKARIYCVIASGVNGNGRFTRIQFQRGGVPSAFRDDGDAFYNASRLTSEINLRTNQAGTYAQQITNLTSQFAGTQGSWLLSQLNTTNQTLSTATTTLSGQITTLKSSIGSLNAPNLLGNGGFANGLSGWTSFGGASWTVITQYTPIFAQSTGNGYSGMYTDVSGIVPGKNYCFGFESDSDGGSNYCYICLRWYDTNGNQVGSDVNGSTANPGNGWGNRIANGPYVAPNGATQARIVIYLYGNDTGNKRVARVQFQQSDQPTAYSDAGSLQGLQAELTEQAGTIADLTNNKLAAYWSVTAQAGNNMAAVTVYASNGQGGLASGVILGGNVQIQGNLLVTGTVDAPQLAGSAVQAVAYTVLQNSVTC